MTSSTPRASLFFSTSILCLACTPDQDFGTARMGLVGQDSNGNVYRLRDAQFELSGPDELTVSTEASTENLQSLNVELAAGPYDVELIDGWRLERWDPITDSTLDVDATLISENPLSTAIGGGETASVVFYFSVPDAGPIGLGDGEIDIDIEVAELPTDYPACDPLSQDCAANEGCYTVDNVFGCAPLSTNLGALEPCEYLNACGASLTCVSSMNHSGCDPTASGCCLPFCDAGASSCASGETCQAIGASGSGFEDVGVCVD